MKSPYKNETLILFLTVEKNNCTKDISRGEKDPPKITTTSGSPSRVFSISYCAALPTIVTSASFLSINYEIL